MNTRYFVYEGAHIRNFSFLLVVNNMVIKGNKIQNWYNVLIVETKCSKFGSETATAWLFLSCYTSANSFLLYFTYLGISRETPAFLLGKLFIFGHKY